MVEVLVMVVAPKPSKKRSWYGTDPSVISGTFAQRQREIAKLPRDQVNAMVLDQQYNEFMYQHADFAINGDEDDPRGHGKRVPYIGWYWRFVSFSSGRFTLGHCGQFVGFMQSNKWDYPARHTTPDEFARCMELIDAAIQGGSVGGSMAERDAARDAKLNALWEYMQTLEVPDDGRY